jgi:ribosomal protein S24E
MENEVKLIGYINSVLDPIKRTLKESNEYWVDYPFVVGVKRGEKSVKWDNIYCISKKPVSNDLVKQLVEVNGSLRVDNWQDENGEYKNKWYVVVYSVLDRLEVLKEIDNQNIKK